MPVLSLFFFKKCVFLGFYSQPKIGNEALFFDYESMFETDELFLGTRFERVIKTISMVSHTSKAKSLGIPAFPEGGVREDIYGGFGSEEEEEEEESIYGDLDQAVSAKVTSQRQRTATVSASAVSAIAAHSGGGVTSYGNDGGAVSSDDEADYGMLEEIYGVRSVPFSLFIPSVSLSPWNFSECWFCHADRFPGLTMTCCLNRVRPVRYLLFCFSCFFFVFSFSFSFFVFFERGLTTALRTASMQALGATTTAKPSTILWLTNTKARNRAKAPSETT